MRKGIQSMYPKKAQKDIPNEDFECNPNGECWCKDEEFPPLPPSDICYSPKEVNRFKAKKLIDTTELGKHLRNRIYHNYGDYFIGSTPTTEQMTSYVEEYLSGKIDKTNDIKYESFDEFKKNRDIE